MAFDYVAKTPVFKVAINRNFPINYCPLLNRRIAENLAPNVGGLFGVVGYVRVDARSLKNIPDKLHEAASPLVHLWVSRDRGALAGAFFVGGAGGTRQMSGDTIEDPAGFL